MDDTLSKSRSKCRLVRADGSEWRVVELRGFEEGLRVDAIRAEPPGNGNGGGADRGAAAPRRPASNGSPPGRLEDELLGRGDRLLWLGEDGDVVWSMKLPMDQARSA